MSFPCIDIFEADIVATVEQFLSKKAISDIYANNDGFVYQKKVNNEYFDTLFSL